MRVTLELFFRQIIAKNFRDTANFAFSVPSGGAGGLRQLLAVAWHTEEFAGGSIVVHVSCRMATQSLMFGERERNGEVKRTRLSVNLREAHCRQVFLFFPFLPFLLRVRRHGSLRDAAESTRRRAVEGSSDGWGVGSSQIQRLRLWTN